MKAFCCLAILAALSSCAPGGSMQEGRVWIEQGGFWIDTYEATIAEFAEFVQATGYKTTSDSLGWSGFFDPQLPGWTVAEGASWAKPDGRNRGNPGSPVTQLSYYDACAYCKWKGGALPTAEEWDMAAGPEPPPGNIWQGIFPFQDEGTDGYQARVAPVGSFPPNQYGLYDMAGNVWEWTQTRLDGNRQGTAFIEGQPAIDSIGGGRIIKGGSFLCDYNVCSGFIPSRYQVTPEDSGLNHLGFRCVYRE